MVEYMDSKGKKRNIKENSLLFKKMTSTGWWKEDKDGVYHKQAEHHKPQKKE